MKTRVWMMGLIAIVVSAQSALAQSPAPEVKIPKGKWFTGERGYREALELQKATGVDILINFFRNDVKDEKGLCAWWEKYGLQSGKVNELLEDYIKVSVEIPLKKRDEATFAAFKFNKTPAVFVAKPTGFPTKINVFDWTNRKPELRQETELVDMITKASTPKAAPAAP